MKQDDIAQDKKMIKKAVRMHDDQLHEGKKTRMKGLKKGGVTTGEMKAKGRNLARAANQRAK